MIVVFSVIAGLVWGGIFALINACLTKKMAAGGTAQLSSLALLRTLIDVFALAAVYFTRNLLPLRFEITMIAAAIMMSLGGIVAAFRTAASMNK